MKGLLLKDIYSLQKYMKTIGVLLIMYGVIGANSNDPSFISGIIILLFTMLSMTTFSYDEAAHWNEFALTLPVSRKKLVLSKYYLCYILTLTGGAVSLVLSYVISILKNTYVLGNILLMIYGICFIALLMMSILFPLLYKFGVEKARLMMILVFLIPFGGVMLLNYLKVPMPSAEALSILLWFSPLILIIVTSASYFISCKILINKEF